MLVRGKSGKEGDGQRERGAAQIATPSEEAIDEEKAVRERGARLECNVVYRAMAMAPAAIMLMTLQSPARLPAEAAPVFSA